MGRDTKLSPSALLSSPTFPSSGMYYATYTFTDGYDVTDDGTDDISTNNTSTKSGAKSGANLDPYFIANDVWSRDIPSVRRR